MTLLKTIELFDGSRANAVPLEAKVEWISQLDMKISAELLAPRGAKAFSGYTVETPLTEELKAPEEYGEIYTLYLNMRLDLMNGEIARHNNSAMLFNRMFKEMADFINRNQAVSLNAKIKAGGIYV